MRAKGHLGLGHHGRRGDALLRAHEIDYLVGSDGLDDATLQAQRVVTRPTLVSIT